MKRINWKKYGLAIFSLPFVVLIIMIASMAEYVRPLIRIFLMSWLCWKGHLINIGWGQTS